MYLCHSQKVDFHSICIWLSSFVCGTKNIILPFVQELFFFLHVLYLSYQVVSINPREVVVYRQMKLIRTETMERDE